MADTGKSTLLKQFIGSSFRKVDVTAPTGVAALNVGGMTIHRFCGMLLGPQAGQSNEDYFAVLERDPRRSILAGFNRVRRCEVLVVDEISMLPGRQIEFVEFLFRRLRGRDEPFGGCQIIFVPCAWGTKEPLVTYVERPFAGTKTPAYRAVFDATETNIAVYLGRASGGLCAIDCDADEDLAAFLAANPELANTTHSRGSRGGMLWVRLTGEFPPSCKSERFEWRADGNLSTSYGRHSAGLLFGEHLGDTRLKGIAV